MVRSWSGPNVIVRSPSIVALSSIYWREAWKYGGRAFRYCQHDVGHAIGTLRVAAATLGWSAALLHALTMRKAPQLQSNAN